MLGPDLLDAADCSPVRIRNPTLLTGLFQRSPASSSQSSAAACRHLRTEPVAPVVTWLSLPVSSSRGGLHSLAAAEPLSLRLESSTQNVLRKLNGAPYDRNPNNLTRQARSLTALLVPSLELIRAASAARQTVMHVSIGTMKS